MAYVIAGLIIAAVLIPGVQQKITDAIQSFSNAIIGPPIARATNAWIEVAIIAAGLGFAIWIIEAKTAKSMGQEIGAPPVESIHVASPPTFGAGGGLSASTSGGVGFTSDVHAQGGGTGARGVGHAPQPRTTKTKTVTKRSAFEE